MVPKPFSEPQDEPLEKTVVVVTPYSTGCCVAKEIQDRGYKLICLWTSWFCDTMKAHVPKSAKGLKWDLVLTEQDTIESTAALVRKKAAENGMEIISIICGGEAGVDLADALSEYMGFLTNGTAIPNRRDKKVQQELIAAAGLRSIRQVSGRKYTQEVSDFLHNETYPVIIKPLDSAGSDGVKRCDSFEEAKAHFNYLLNEHVMVNSEGACDEVLCQEFLKGTEYVVDHVSLNGVHKTVMVWRYDKRSANGASFVYFGDVPVDSESPEATMLIPYARGVLDALGCLHGPSHGEFIITEDGPCLVEMNCRAHGGDGIWQPLCRALTGGYNQVDATVDAYLAPENFMKLPDKPPSPFKTSGQCVDLVSYKGGIVKSAPGYDVIRLLPSFVVMETHVEPGSRVTPTVDLATDAGTLIVMNDDKEALAQDIALIRQMESIGVLFQTDEENRKTKEATETGPFKMLASNSRANSMVYPKPEQKFKKLEKDSRANSLSFYPPLKTKFTMLDASARANSLIPPHATNSARHRRMMSSDTPQAYMAAKHI